MAYFLKPPKLKVGFINVSKPYAGLSLSTVCFTLLISHTSAWSQINSDSCLYAAGNGQNQMKNCNGDVRDFANLEAVKDTVKALGIQHLKINFVGCEITSFSAREKGPDRERQEFFVTYPAMDGHPIDKLIAPIMHELGHVYQLYHAGSFAKLLKLIPSSEKRELEADFLAGLAFSKLQKRLNINDFQNNLSLIGMYKETPENAHGQPEVRISSFRFGVYNHLTNPSQDLATARNVFQTDKLPSIKKMRPDRNQ